MKDETKAFLSVMVVVMMLGVSISVASLSIAESEFEFSTGDSTTSVDVETPIVGNSFENEGVTYTFVSIPGTGTNGILKVTDTSSTETNIVIADCIMINGNKYDVKSVESLNASSVATTLTIPKSVQTMDSYDLSKWSKLTTISIPNSLKIVDNAELDATITSESNLIPAETVIITGEGTLESGYKGIIDTFFSESGAWKLKNSAAITTTLIIDANVSLSNLSIAGDVSFTSNANDTKGGSFYDSDGNLIEPSNRAGKYFTLKDEKSTYVPVTSISLSEKTKLLSTQGTYVPTLTGGGMSEGSGIDAIILKTYTPKVTIEPAAIKLTQITWDTSDKNIATVSEDGVVTPVAAGNVTITATSADGSGKNDSVTIEVTDKMVSNLKVTVAKSTSVKFYETDGVDKITAGKLIAETTTGSFIDIPFGNFVIEGIDKEGSMGKTQFTVDKDTTSITAFKITQKASNSNWILDKDYTIDVSYLKLISLGDKGSLTISETGSTITNKTTLRYLVMNGDTTKYTFTPSENHIDEGYMSFFGSNTRTSAGAINVKIPLGMDVTLTVPKDADVFFGYIISHYIPFEEISETKYVEDERSFTKTFTYHVATGSVFNYRVSGDEYVTFASQFTANANNANITVSEEDLYHLSKTITPETQDRNLNNLNGFNVADLYVGINEQNYLSMEKVGDKKEFLTFKVYQAQLGVTDNYFFTPDNYIKIIDLDGNESSDVISIKETDGYYTIEALKNGTAIVLISYYALSANGTFYGALWEENTAAFIVTVGAKEVSFEKNITINERLNGIDSNNDGVYESAPLTVDKYGKTSGINVDAEFDVFYYLKGEDGYKYTFVPENGCSVSVLNPTYGENGNGLKMITGFTTGNTAENEDGSFTVTLKQGRNIVSITKDGATDYQVMTAKEVSYTITNDTNEGSAPAPGDTITILFDTVYQPVVKLAAVYNMGARMIFIDEFGNQIGKNYTGYGEYNFASARQSVTVTIPSDLEEETYTLSYGYINERGFGSYYGLHRNIDFHNGLGPNFTAVTQVSFFGALPSITIDVEPATIVGLNIDAVEGTATKLYDKTGTIISANDSGDYTYSVRTGTYSFEATCDGYKTARGEINVEENTTYVLEMEKILEGDWDGTTKTEPFADANGTYLITNGAELAWLSGVAGTSISVKLMNDIELSGFQWTPLGTSTNKFSGTFDGNGYKIDNLYIAGTAAYMSLFGCANDLTVIDLEIGGSVTGGNYASGFISYAYGTISISGCINNVDVVGKQYLGGIIGDGNNATIAIEKTVNNGDIFSTSAANAYVGGIAGRISNTYENIISECANRGHISNAFTSATSNTFAGGIIAYYSGIIEDCYNSGAIDCAGYSAGIVGCVNQNVPISAIFNSYNAGTVSSLTNSGSICATNSNKTNSVLAINSYYVEGTAAVGCYSSTSKISNAMEITLLDLHNNGAIMLGNAFTSVDGSNPELISLISSAATSNVVFVDVEGNVIADEKVERGTSTKIVDAPEIYGQSFIGWKSYNSDEYYEEETYLAKTDMIFIAEYSTIETGEYDVSIKTTVVNGDLMTEITLDSKTDFSDIDDPIICIWAEYKDHKFLHVYSDIVLFEGSGNTMALFANADEVTNVYAIIYNGIPSMTEDGVVNYGMATVSA